jgi:hypothetical protein
VCFSCWAFLHLGGGMSRFWCGSACDDMSQTLSRAYAIWSGDGWKLQIIENMKFVLVLWSLPQTVPTDPPTCLSVISILHKSLFLIGFILHRDPSTQPRSQAVLEEDPVEDSISVRDSLMASRKIITEMRWCWNDNWLVGIRPTREQYYIESLEASEISW